MNQELPTRPPGQSALEIELGRVLIEFSLLEQELDVFLSSIVGRPRDMGMFLRPILCEMSVSSKINALAEVFFLRSQSAENQARLTDDDREEYRKRLAKLLKRVDAANSKRNELVHSNWTLPNSYSREHTLIKWPRRRNTPGVFYAGNVSALQIRQVVESIQGIRNDLKSFRNALGDQRLL